MMMRNIELALIVIICGHPSHAVLPPAEDWETCEANGACPERRALLQRDFPQPKLVAINEGHHEARIREACPLDISGMKDAKGNVEPLTETGFEAVRACCCMAQMREWIRRLVESQSNVVCEPGGLDGFTQHYYCNDYPEKNFAGLVAEVGPGKGAQSGDCPWIGFGKDLTCPTLDPIKCPDFSGATNPPCVGCSSTTATTTTATTTTTTTTTPLGPATTTTTYPLCPGGAKDIFMAIDASRSVKNDGWLAEQDFAAALAEAIAGGGNPTGHRINAHWFNDVTSPTCVAASGSDWCLATGESSVAPGNPHTDRPNNLIYQPNNIGIFSTNAVQIASDIRSLDYNSIKAGSTDHPQVLLTAKQAFDETARAISTKKLIVLITDGRTHKGNNCPSLEDAKAVVGDCSVSTHPCNMDCSDQLAHKCMCGMYHATNFKKDNPDITLGIVAIPNGIAGTTFNAMMGAMASPGQLYSASGFDGLPALLPQLVAGLCQ